MEISKYSAAKLEKELAKHFERASEINDEFIAMGFGDLTSKESIEKLGADHKLSKRFLVNRDKLSDLIYERKRRMEWYGSLKPIKNTI